MERYLLGVMGQVPILPRLVDNCRSWCIGPERLVIHDPRCVSSRTRFVSIAVIFLAHSHSPCVVDNKEPPELTFAVGLLS